MMQKAERCDDNITDQLYKWCNQALKEHQIDYSFFECGEVCFFIQSGSWPFTYLETRVGYRRSLSSFLYLQELQELTAHCSI